MIPLKRRLAISLSIVGFAVAGPSSATARPALGSHVFAGDCVGHGYAAAARPITWVPVYTSAAFDGTGMCAGTLDGEPLARTPTIIRLDIPDALLSCGPGLENGTGTLSFQLHGRAVPLAIRIQLLDFGPATTFGIEGRVGGIAIGFGDALPGLDAALACAGRGLNGLAFSLALSTGTPLRG